MLKASRYLAIGSVLGLSLFFVSSAHANSFSAALSLINNAYEDTFYWSTDGTGGTITFSNCATGVTIKNEAGAAVSCGSPQSVSGSSDSASFTFYNVSGSAKTLQASFTPTGAASSDPITVPVTVYNASQVITSFTASPYTVASGGSATFTWTGVYIPGTNLQFDCSPYLTVWSGSTQLPCGSPAFTSDLAQSSSQAVTVKSTSGADTTLTARLLPAIAVGAYDATNAKVTTIAVTPASAATVSPGVSSFTSSASLITSGGAATLSWGSYNVSGANLQFACGYDLKVQAVVSGATTTLPCNTPAFSSALAATGTQTIYVANSNTYAQVLMVTLLPQDANGIYLGTISKYLSILVNPPGANSTSSTYPTVPSVPASTPPSATTTHIPITIALEKGSKGSQVTILQAFLSADKTIYPEGTVSGYFGALTEAAVKKFQVKYGLAKQGDTGYGYVGPKTRAKINSLATP